VGTAIHIELDALCLLILCVVVWQSVRNVNQQMKIIRFRNVVYGIMIALALDIVWMLVDGVQFPGAIAINYIVNAVFLGLGVLLGCMWYLYVLDALGYYVQRKNDWIVLLPGLVFMALNIISIWTGWIFSLPGKTSMSAAPCSGCRRSALSACCLYRFSIFFTAPSGRSIKWPKQRSGNCLAFISFR